MHLAAGQPPDQVGIDGAESELAALGALAGAFDVVEDPANLGRRKKRVEQQSGLARHHFLVTRGPQAVGDAGGAAILPDDGIVDRLAGRPVPDNRRLALVGDADGSNFGGGQPGLLEGGLHRPKAGRPDLLGHVLDPARRRKMLGKLHLAQADDLLQIVEDDGAARGRALVDGEDIAAHCLALLNLASR